MDLIKPQVFWGTAWLSVVSRARVSFPSSLYTIYYYILGMVKYHLHIMFLFAIRLCPKSSQNTSTSAQFSSGHSACCAGLNVTLFKQRTKGNTCANIPNKYNNTQYMWHYMWYLYSYMYMCIYACKLYLYNTHVVHIYYNMRIYYIIPTYCPYACQFVLLCQGSMRLPRPM